MILLYQIKRDKRDKFRPGKKFFRILKFFQNSMAGKHHTDNFILGRQARTYTLVNEIRPVSKPAHITCSPYTANGIGSCLSCSC